MKEGNVVEFATELMFFDAFYHYFKDFFSGRHVTETTVKLAKKAMYT